VLQPFSSGQHGATTRVEQVLILENIQTGKKFTQNQKNATIFQFFKLALKDAEENSLQLYYRNICSKMNNKVTKR
jgi:hypothetical protein